VDIFDKFLGLRIATISRACGFGVSQLTYPFNKPNGIENLFYCHAFGEVSRLVYVAAAADGYVVGEELEGDYFEDGEE
jgi:hypothetical protein